MLIKVDIRTVWQDIRPGLDKLSQVQRDWIPEDIYAACIHGDAICFVDDEYNDGGCLIVRYVPEPYTDELVFFIWAVTSYEQNAVKHHWEEIKYIAKQSGCTKIRFTTKRKGLERLMKDNELYLEEAVYACDL